MNKYHKAIEGTLRDFINSTNRIILAIIVLSSIMELK